MTKKPQTDKNRTTSQEQQNPNQMVLNTTRRQFNISFEPDFVQRMSQIHCSLIPLILH